MAIRKTTAQFIEQAIVVHGNKYDYSSIQYVSSRKKVVILCGVHGRFAQLPGSHLSGYGCPGCKGLAISASLRNSRQQFIDKAVQVHGDRYDYSGVEYSSGKSPVKIRCSCHGWFEQRPDNHLSGAGCRHCANESKAEHTAWQTLLAIGIDFEREKGFPSLRRKYPLRFDFFLPSLSLLIEVDGAQHGREWPGRTESLAVNQDRDAIKDRWANENGYRLVRIPHTCKDVASMIREIVGAI
jgi:very-short-patch-repair endonuclease